MADVKTIQEGEIALVTLDRPEKRNALTVAATKELADAIRKAASSYRVIVITGEGSAFCAGGDFQELARFASKNPKAAADDLYEGFQSLILAIREVEVPVIAAVNGHAMGAGMDLALACDLRVAAIEARFGQVWVRVGLVPGTGGAFWVSWLAGPGRAAEMVLTGKHVDAETAHSWGLVNEVVAQEFVVPRALELGKELAENPPGALAENKKLLNAVIEDAYRAALEGAREVQPGRFSSDEFAAAIGLRLDETEPG